MLYAQNYARIVRERWDIGECGEDVLFLVVHSIPAMVRYSYLTLSIVVV